MGRWKYSFGSLNCEATVVVECNGDISATIYEDFPLRIIAAVKTGTPMPASMNAYQQKNVQQTSFSDNRRPNEWVM
jgi:hypothetical protein